MKVFISYCDDDGLDYARQSAVILESHRNQAWYFDRNKTPGVPRIYDITKHIRHWSDIVLLLCTNGSLYSIGQWKEIIQWDSTDKQLIVIVIDNATVPREVDGYIYVRTNSKKFEKEFDSFVRNDLVRSRKMFMEWRPTIKVKKE